MQATSLDLRKEMSAYYRPSADEVEVVMVPKMQFIMIDGKGDPSGTAFQETIQAMYGLAYTIKFDVKRDLKKIYPVMPLEGLWWMKGGDFDMTKRDDWLWTLMMMQPDLVTRETFDVARESVRHKRDSAALGLAHLGTFEEGLCLQTMHIGPYSAEPATILRLDRFAKENRYRMVGKHHEIYMGDPRRAAPSKLKTVIRRPVRKIHAR